MPHPRSSMSSKSIFGAVLTPLSFAVSLSLLFVPGVALPWCALATLLAVVASSRSARDAEVATCCLALHAAFSLPASWYAGPAQALGSAVLVIAFAALPVAVSRLTVDART